MGEGISSNENSACKVVRQEGAWGVLRRETKANVAELSEQVGADRKLARSVQ